MRLSSPLSDKMQTFSQLEPAGEVGAETVTCGASLLSWEKIGLKQSSLSPVIFISVSTRITLFSGIFHKSPLYFQNLMLKFLWYSVACAYCIIFRKVLIIF